MDIEKLSEQGLSREKKLLEMLSVQNMLLDTIVATQRQIQTAIANKNWEKLEISLYAVNDSADAFSRIEEQRNTLSQKITESEGEPSMFSVLDHLSAETRSQAHPLFKSLRKKLLLSRLENEQMLNFVKIRQTFLQGIFDSAVPNARNKVYSRNGSLVKAQPERLVLDTVM